MSRKTLFSLLILAVYLENVHPFDDLSMFISVDDSKLSATFNPTFSGTEDELSCVLHFDQQKGSAFAVQNPSTYSVSYEYSQGQHEIHMYCNGDTDYDYVSKLFFVGTPVSGIELEIPDDQTVDVIDGESVQFPVTIGEGSDVTVTVKDVDGNVLSEIVVNASENIVDVRIDPENIPEGISVVEVEVSNSYNNITKYVVLNSEPLLLSPTVSAERWSNGTSPDVSVTVEVQPRPLNDVILEVTSELSFNDSSGNQANRTVLVFGDCDLHEVLFTGDEAMRVSGTVINSHGANTTTVVVPAAIVNKYVITSTFADLEISTQGVDVGTSQVPSIISSTSRFPILTDQSLFDTTEIKTVVDGIQTVISERHGTSAVFTINTEDVFLSASKPQIPKSEYETLLATATGRSEGVLASETVTSAESMHTVYVPTSGQHVTHSFLQSEDSTALTVADSTPVTRSVEIIDVLSIIQSSTDIISQAMSDISIFQITSDDLGTSVKKTVLITDSGTASTIISENISETISSVADSTPVTRSVEIIDVLSIIQSSTDIISQAMSDISIFQITSDDLGTSVKKTVLITDSGTASTIISENISETISSVADSTPVTRSVEIIDVLSIIQSSTDIVISQAMSDISIFQITSDDLGTSVKKTVLITDSGTASTIISENISETISSVADSTPVTRSVEIIDVLSIIQSSTDIVISQAMSDISIFQITSDDLGTSVKKTVLITDSGTASTIISENISETISSIFDTSKALVPTVSVVTSSTGKMSETVSLIVDTSDSLDTVVPTVLVSASSTEKLSETISPMFDTSDTVIPTVSVTAASTKKMFETVSSIFDTSETLNTVVASSTRTKPEAVSSHMDSSVSISTEPSFSRAIEPSKISVSDIIRPTGITNAGLSVDQETPPVSSLSSITDSSSIYKSDASLIPTNPASSSYLLPSSAVVMSRSELDQISSSGSGQESDYSSTKAASDILDNVQSLADTLTQVVLLVTGTDTIQQTGVIQTGSTAITHNVVSTVYTDVSDEIESSKAMSVTTHSALPTTNLGLTQKIDTVGASLTSEAIEGTLQSDFYSVQVSRSKDDSLSGFSFDKITETLKSELDSVLTLSGTIDFDSTIQATGTESMLILSTYSVIQQTTMKPAVKPPKMDPLKCLKNKNLFDLNFDSSEKALTVLASEITDITATVDLLDTKKCADLIPELIWQVENVDEQGILTLIDIEQTESLTLRFDKSNVDIGVYKISLNVSLGYNISLVDDIYVRFINPYLVAAIYGGTQRVFKYGVPVTMDAISQSYDPRLGFGSGNTLEYAWTCHTVNATAAEISNYIALNGKISEMKTKGCDVDLQSSGTLDFDGGDLPRDMWSLFEVVVSKDNLTGSAIQAIYTTDDTNIGSLPGMEGLAVVEGHPNFSISIRCRRNCDAKVVHNTKMALEATCTQCTNTAVFSWDVMRFNKSTNNLILVNADPGWSTTGLNSSWLNVYSYMLNPGDIYQFRVGVTDNNATSFAAYQINVNEPPYGGTCQISPQTGTALFTPFEVQCSGWLDEGIKEKRDTQKDGDNSITYYFLQKFNDNTSNVLKNGPIPSVNGLKLRQGEPPDYDSTVSVRIIDQFSAFTEVNLGVQVKPAFQDELTDMEPNVAIDAIESFLENVTNLLDEALKWGDTDSFLQQTEAIAETINNLMSDRDIGSKENVTSWGGNTSIDENGNFALNLSANGTFGNETWKSLWDDYRESNQDLVTEKLKESLIMLSEKVGEVLKNEDLKTYSDINQAVEVYEELVANPQLVKDNSKIHEEASNLMLRASKAFLNATDDTALPNEIEEAADAIMSLVSNLVDATVPDKLPLWMNDVDKFMVYDKTSTDLEYGPQYIDTEGADLTQTEENFLVYKNAQKVSEDIRSKKDVSETTINNIVETVKNVQKALFPIMSLGGEPYTIKKDKVSLTVQKVKGGGLINATLTEEESTVHVEGTFSDCGEMEESEPGQVRNGDDDEYVSLGLARYDKTIFFQDRDGQSSYVDNAVGSVISVDENGCEIGLDKSTFSQNYHIPSFGKTTRRTNVIMTTVAPGLVDKWTMWRHIKPACIEDDASGFFYHKTKIRADGEYTCIKIKPAFNASADIYFREDDYPTILDYNRKTSLPSKDGMWIHCLSPSVMMKTDRLFLAVKILTDMVPKEYRSMLNISSSCSEIPYDMLIKNTACRLWNKSRRQWEWDKCKLNWSSDDEIVECHCESPKDMTFGTGFFVPPNEIDFPNVFLKFSPQNQWAVILTLLIVFVTYILFVIYARYKDKLDILKWGVMPLKDNCRDDKYFYLLTITTGMRRASGTRSKVEFVLGSSTQDSGVRQLSDGIRQGFNTGSVMHFVMATDECLGDLDYMLIWHDNSGEGNCASWYLNQIEVEDLQTRQKYVFLCGKWISTMEDGIEKPKCLLTVTTKEDLSRFRSLFLNQFKKILSENHIWYSVFYRPTKSNFTRVQRVSCAYSFILLTMICNAMYFYPQDDFVHPTDIIMGPIVIRLSELYISLVCVLITTASTIVIIAMFKYAKPKKTEIVDGSEEIDNSEMNKMDFLRQTSFMLEKTLVVNAEGNKQKCGLPHCCVYIGWLLVFLAFAASSFFLLLFSMEWGQHKSEKWLTSFFLSFFESAIVLDPMKIVCLAFIFAIIFKRSGLKRLNRSSSEIHKDAVDLSKAIPLTSQNEGTISREVAPPMSKEAVVVAKADQERRYHLKIALQELIMNLVFIAIICSISYCHLDNRLYDLQQHVHKTLVAPHGHFNYTQIRTKSDIFNWLHDTFLPNMYPERLYNGWRLTHYDRQFFAGSTSFKIGPPQLSQMRITPDDCRINMDKTGKKRGCFYEYDSDTAEHQDFCIGWKKLPCDRKQMPSRFSLEAWRYTEQSVVDGYMNIGSYKTYGGGSYVAEFEVNLDVSKEISSELLENMWIDRGTRALILDFTLFCANINAAVYSLFIMEIPETGGVIPHVKIHPMLLSRVGDTFKVTELASEILFSIFVLFLTIVIAWNLLKENKNYFKKLIRVVDLLIWINSVVTMGFYFKRKVEGDKAMDEWKHRPNDAISFKSVAMWDSFFLMSTSVLLFLTNLRVLGMLSYSRRLGAFGKLIQKSAADIITFGVIFVAIFLVYAFCGNLLFGSTVQSFRNIYSTVCTLFASLVESNEFMSIRISHEYLGHFYYFAFVFFMVVIMMTVFVAIMYESMHAFHSAAETNESSKLMDYLFNSVHGFFGSKKKLKGMNTGTGVNMFNHGSNFDSTPNVMGLGYKPFNSGYLMPNEASYKILDLQYQDNDIEDDAVMAQSSEGLLIQLVTQCNKQDACPSDLKVMDLDNYDFYNPSYELKHRKGSFM